MKTLAEVNKAREILADRMGTEPVDRTQYACLSGMLNALIWVAGDEHCDTIKRVLASEPFGVHKKQ